MSTVVEQLAAAVIELAQDMPGHRPIRSAFWDDTTAWHVDGAPNSLLAYAVEAVKPIATKIPADAFAVYAINVGMASENLPRWGVKLTEPWAKWFDAIVMKEHGGATWGEALAAAGPIPTDESVAVAPAATTAVVPVDDVIEAEVVDAEIVEDDGVPAADGIYPDVPEDVYHGDPGSISSSQARTILKPGGPALLRYAPRKESKAFDYGHVAHELILGKGQGIEVVTADDWRTKAAKEARAEAYAAGRVPVLRKEFERAESRGPGDVEPVGRVVGPDRLTHLAQVHATLALAAATALSGVISNNVTPGSAINELAHDKGAWAAVDEWHKVSAQPSGGDQ